MANSTWNPADLASVTLSGGNLTATATVTGAWVRAVDKKLPGAGKFYWEVRPTVWASGNTTHGFCASTLSSPSGVTNNGICGFQLGGSLYVGPSWSGINIGGSAGSTYGIAVDLTGNLVWFRVAPAGNWNNSGTASPGGTGGLSITSIFSPDAVPLAALGTTNDAVVANFGDTAFSGVVPAGFTAGWPGAASAAAAQARVMVLA